jgi:carbon monoxide dehydrogenase subunit G
VKLQYSGQERITAAPDVVWAFVTEPDKVVNCVPELVEGTVRDPSHFDAVVRVAVGPVRGKFTFKFEMQPDPATRRMQMRITGGGFGSAVDMTATSDVVAAPDDATVLNWSGEAVMRGPVAAVGGRVLDSQARKLITQTFANVRERLQTS